MKRTLAVLGALAAVSVTPALAADLSRPVYKAAPPVTAPVPYYTWTGLYIGGHAGAGWAGDDDLTFSTVGLGVDPATIGGSGDAGFVGGGQIGYNWQLGTNWVIGVEGDFSWTDIGSSGTAALVPAGTLAMNRDLNWLASVRGRLGYSWDRFLMYATGGVAWGDFDYGATASIGPSVTAAVSDTQTGWVVGGGGEWAFAPNWSLRAEYLHYQFDGTSASVPAAGGTVNVGWPDSSVDVVRAGVNYKFGDWFGKAPVPPRY